MARIDRLLPPHSRRIIEYDAEHMEQFHKRTYRSFLAMRQKIKTEYDARAVKTVIDGKTYYDYYNLENNVWPGYPGHDLLRWHGMPEESIQEIIDFHDANDIDRLKLRWGNRVAFDSIFFSELEQIIQQIISVTQGTYLAGMLEADLSRAGVTTDEEKAVWNIYFALNLITITDLSGEAKLEINTTLRQEIIDAVEAGDTIDPGYGDPVYVIGGDIDRAYAGIDVLNSLETFIFNTPAPIELGYILIRQDTLMSKTGFENISQDDFFDIYAPSLFIDWKIDESWWEKFIGGLLKLIGDLLNLVLDVLLSIPIFGDILEFILDGVASLFNMTLEEARMALIQAIVFVVALYFSVPTGGSSMYTYLEWVSSAWSLGGIAGELAGATYEDPIQQIEESEEEELKREIEKMQHELNLIVGLEEPIIRLNRPEEELRVNGDNNSTYTIFRLD